MRVLGIDTSTPVISIALLEDEVTRAERTDIVTNNRTGLLTMIDQMFADLGLRPADIDAVAAGAGPGSFTGLRIGMATAKGIAFAAGKPLWAVSSLAALAFAELTRDASAPVVAVIDARRGEVYAGAYHLDSGRLAAIGDERVLPPAELATFAPAGARYTGDAAVAYPELATLPGTWGTTPTASAVARVALAGAHVDVLVGGAPSYIRPSEAEVKYPDGVPGALRKR